MSTRVLVAFDKFKDALPAARACAIAAREIRRAHPDWIVACAPITDGGDGFCPILTESVGGELIMLPASGPRLERREVAVGMIECSRLPVAAQAMLSMGELRGGRIAVIEMAAVNGLALVPSESRDPWQTTSFGTGQLIRAAAELGARGIVLGVGGSATNDLGFGALNALGYEFRHATGAKVRPPFPATWEHVAMIEGELFGSIPPIAIACDVVNPLLGRDGAAAVYGPQKGLRAEDLSRHEVQAARLAALLCGLVGRDVAELIARPGSGAAGGIAFGLMAAARAQLVPGFDLVAAWLDLDAKIAAADIVLTGEGRFDATSLSGKGPGAIAQRARTAGRRVVVLAGAVADELTHVPEVHAITPPGTPLPEALTRAEQFLAAAVGRWVT